jgi:hypothetical protein
MQRVGGRDEWRVTLRLPSGGYRYRYFADRGGTLVHVAPAEVEHEPVAMRRFDATLYAGDRIQPDVVHYAR